MAKLNQLSRLSSILWLSFFLLLYVIILNVSASTKIRQIVVTAKSEKERDSEGFEAITQLHRQMDDDKSGSIDRTESTGFLKDDMHIAESDRLKREKAFHHNDDDSITVDDLWESWFESDERGWTVEQTIDWLTNAVQLPQYSELFSKMEVEGLAMPRLAVQNSSYMQTILGIKNAVHRQKLQLKALDVVLFGYRDSSSRGKDVALAILVIGLVTVLFIFGRHKALARQQMADLASKMKELQSLESDFQGMQEQFEENRKKQREMSDRYGTEESNEEVESLRSQLQEYERRLERSSMGCAPLALQPFLRKTCELEMSYVGQQRIDCVREMRDAMEDVEKLRKKQSSIVSSLKLATGSNSGTEDLDQKIFRLKSKMEKITRAMEDCQQRWIQIESLCGFPLICAPPSGYVRPNILSTTSVPICPPTKNVTTESVSSQSWAAVMHPMYGSNSIGSRSAANVASYPSSNATLINGSAPSSNGDYVETSRFTVDESNSSSCVSARHRKVPPDISEVGRSQSHQSLASGNGAEEKRKRNALSALFKKK